MKKIIVLLGLLTSLYSDSKIYLGLSYGYYSEDFTRDVDAKSSGAISNLKIAYGDRDAYSVEFSLESKNNDSKIFSQNDSKKTGLNINLVKSFNINTYIIPFFKAGIGSGSLEIQRATQEKLHYGSFNLGTGLLIPINENFDFEIAYNYQAISYEGIDVITEQISYKSNLNSATFGFNTRF